jgi:hypothetical protein
MQLKEFVNEMRREMEIMPSVQALVVHNNAMRKCPSDKEVLIKLNNLLSIILQ